MCGFAGFGCFDSSLWDERYLWANLGKRMCSRISHRGPDDRGVHVSSNCVLAHARLAVIDPLLGAQPMSAKLGGREVTIAYNGEVYNAKELKKELEALGHNFSTECDTEVVLKAYIEYGEDFPEKLNGIFAFAIDDTYNDKIFLCRDRFGVKPLFYTTSENRLVFSSEIKGLLEYPGIRPVIDKQGICEIFGLGPARTPGCGVFKNIFEIKPGYMAVFDKNGFADRPYYQIAAGQTTDSYAEAVEKVRYLLDDIANRQLISDVPICTFLSGGLDSSVITALAAQKMGEKGRTLDTYSFCMEGNDKYFSPNKFQPMEDEPWARRVSESLGTNHSTLVCTNDEQYNCLIDAVIAKDLPGMADVDSSLLYFCREVKKNHSVALCGECADEIFGGYPWFDEIEFDNFPWSRELDFRSQLIKPEIGAELNLKDYVLEQFEKTMMDAPAVSGEGSVATKQRQMSYLNIRWFMQTLLDRKDRCSMYSGLEVRVPYADHRLVEYVYNTPWDYKCAGGVKKSLLRDAARGLLPEDVIYRKKSPYPKTHNPGYEALLKSKLKYILMDSLQPLHKIISKEAAEGLLSETFDYGKPWFGQLMAGPQLLAYLIQINYWMIRYNIKVEI